MNEVKAVPTNEILHGPVLDRLRGLPDESVHCVVTSPPYYGLRNYNLEPCVWSDMRSCEHEWEPTPAPGGTGNGKSFRRDQKAGRRRGDGAGDVCANCGAWRGHLGLEPLHDCGAWAAGRAPCTLCYVCHIRSVFSEVRRILRPEGTLWLNLGDTYSTSSGGIHKAENSGKHARRIDEMGPARQPNRGKMLPGLKPKDLMMIPSRCALALQADGWYVRRDIIWAKPNPMPESTDDRPTCAHEYLYLMAKSERYFCDMTAIREPMTQTSIDRLMQTSFNTQKGGVKDGVAGRHKSSRKSLQNVRDRLVRSLDWPEKDEYWGVGDPTGGRNRRDVWSVAIEPFSMEFCTACKRPYEGPEFSALPEEPTTGSRLCACGRADSWLSHFATFPQGIVEPCLLAGTSERGACAACGAPYARKVERTFVPQPDVCAERGVRGAPGQKPLDKSNDRDGYPRGSTDMKTVGWAPTCKCGGESTTPCVVLDPFMGSGTVAMVALRAGRQFVGVDLNPDYIAMAEARIAREKVQSRMF
jgi:DNA modification methylase